MNEFEKYEFSESEMKQLYRLMLLPRLVEEKMISLLRQGKISKWFSGIGQEAISVGCTHALRPDELIFTLHRNLGVFTTRDIPLFRLFAQWQGKSAGFTKGRDRSFHFGSREHHIIGMISHLGPQLSLAAGAALAYRLKKEKRVSLVFTGEGGTSEGEFHEALNVASVWDLPVIFVIENNGYGLSTPPNQQYKCKNLVDRALGYGMKSKKIDGNNILEVVTVIRKIAKKMREKPRPYLVECSTFRMRGHEEASGIKYVPPEDLEAWAQRDPILLFENHLLDRKILHSSDVESIRRGISTSIQSELSKAIEEPLVEFDISQETGDIFQSYEVKERPNAIGPVRELRFIEAITEGLDQSMQEYQNLVLMGQDIAEYGGVFKVTEGLLEKYGAGRVRNTPLCESAIIGIALGLSMEGMKSMVEMQFADFVSCGFNQIVNNLAKIHYRWGENADVVIRMPTGAGVGAGPFHSQSTEAWFTHTPGLKIVYPSSPFDAKGLLLASIEDPNPVLFFEHKALYRSVRGEVPEKPYTLEIGKANTVSKGNQVSIITYGLGVHWAMECAKEMDINAEILDLRSIVPLDHPAIEMAVKKTSRVLILHEDVLFGGIGGEISAYISENLFEHLDAPIFRVGSLDTPVPFVKNLEDNFLAKSRLKEGLMNLIEY